MRLDSCTGEYTIWEFHYFFKAIHFLDKITEIRYTTTPKGDFSRHDNG